MFLAWWANLMRIIMNLCMNGYFHCHFFPFRKTGNKNPILDHPGNTPGVALMPQCAVWRQPPLVSWASLPSLSVRLSHLQHTGML